MKQFDYLWVLPFFSFSTGYLFFYLLFYVASVETPLLVGKNLIYAIRILSDQNLNLRIITQKEDNSLPDGTIISQIPNPGQKIKPHQTLFCVVSQKVMNIAPVCIHYFYDQIIQNFKSKNFRIKKYFIESKYPKGLCIGQIFEAQNPLEQKIIQIYISSGNNTIVLFPELKGMMAKEVIEFLKQYNFFPTLNHTTSIESVHECITCKVVDQKPLAGSLINLAKPLQIQLQVR